MRQRGDSTGVRSCGIMARVTDPLRLHSIPPAADQADERQALTGSAWPDISALPEHVAETYVVGRLVRDVLVEGMRQVGDYARGREHEVTERERIQVQHQSSGDGPAGRS